MRLWLISDAAETETNELFEAAASARGIETTLVDPCGLGAPDALVDATPALVYRAHTSLAAVHVEQRFVAAGAASFHRLPEDAFFLCTNQPRAFACLGIPTPRTVSPIPTERAVLLRQVESLGSFPIVVKVLGGSYGVGVMRLDTSESLLSIVDFVDAWAAQPALLCEYVRHGAQYRLYVVGDEVVAALRQTPGDGDFRTNRPGRRFEAVEEAVDHAALADLAVRSCRALRVETGGVDVLVSVDGRLLVTEVNFPAYLPRAQVATGVDIAGRMLDHLLRKAAAGPRRRTRRRGAER